MNRKAMSIWLSALLIGTLFTVVFMGTVSAMNDEQNLSGLVWRADGTPPSQATNFCIWVLHGGTWYRFPETGFAQTQVDVNGNYWYSYVLPDEYASGSGDERWGDGDLYRVQVDGTPWSNLNGNCTSNATNPPPSGDPDPTSASGYVYDPTNPANSNNTINYAAGGGLANEQQWDVRTVAPLDLAPTGVAGHHLWPQDYPLGIPIPANQNIDIDFNVTNFGLIDSEIYQVTVTECNAAGVNTGATLYDMSHPVLAAGATLSLWGIVTWLSPNSVGDFYINITVDSLYTNPEYDEVNNRFILHFKIGADLIPTNVLVDGILPTNPIYVGPDIGVVITAWVENIGFSDTPGGEMVGAYYGATPLSPGDSALPALAPGESTGPYTWYWNLPTAMGDYYVDIIVDVNDDTAEASEDNNEYTLHFFVGPNLAPNNVTVEYTPVTGFVVINPLLFYSIGVNATNLGPSSTGNATFRITYAECDASGAPFGAPFWESAVLNTTLEPGESSIDVYGDWQAPLFTPGQLDYYINITIDYYDTVDETNEGNNYYTLHLRMDAPDLTPFTVNVWVGGLLVQAFDSIPPYVSSIVEVPRGADVTIEIIVTNIGGVGSGQTNVTFYNLSGVGGPPIDDPFAEPILPGVTPGGTQTVSGLWANPGYDGMFYVNISIDFNGTDLTGRVPELNEYNNYFTLQINTTPIPITYFQPNQPRLFNTTGDAYYITSTTQIQLSSQGGTPPRYTWFRILWLSNSTQVLPWTNYTLMPFFTIPYGEFAYEVQYYTFDSVGALELTKSSFVIVDDSPPTTNINVGDRKYRASGADNWNVTRMTPFTLSAADNPPGIDIDLLINKASGIDNPTKTRSGIFYRISGGFGSTGWFEGTSFSMNAINPAFVDGLYTIYYNSTDNLGNMEPTKSITIYLDNTGPSTGIAVGDPQYIDIGLFVKSDTPYTLSGNDGFGCGVNTSTFQFMIGNQDTGNGISWTGYTAPFDIYSSISAVMIYEGDGNYTISYRSTDWLGNSGPQSSITLYVDETAPYVTLVVGDPRYRANDTLDIWNVTDETLITLSSPTDGPGCGFNITEYLISNATQDWGWQIYSAVPIQFTGFEDGEYSIDYRITDFLDNSRTMRETINLDTTTPTTDIVIGDPKYPDVPVLNITSATTVTLIGTDIGTEVDFTLYEVTTLTDIIMVDSTQYTGPFTLDGLADGQYKIYYYSVDMLGNEEPEMVYSVNLDNTGPTTTIDIYSGFSQENPDGSYNVEFNTFFLLTAEDGGGSGVDVIEYRVDGDPTWLTYTARFNLTLETHGYWDHTLEFRARDNLGNYGPTGSLEVYIEGDVTPPDPPVLKLYVQGNDILLDWVPSLSLDVDHYLIYRSTTKTGFDFTAPWKDTGADNDMGIIHLRSQWNDTGAVSGAPEYYYAIRGVDGRTNIGPPSNIAGKVTLTFSTGYNTFSLPLEPFEDMTAADMLSDGVFADTTDTIYRYDTENQEWTGRPKFMPAGMNDFDLSFGEGYMLNIKETTVHYTFTGAAATSIRYRSGVGDEDTFRNSLEVTTSQDSVTLSWEPATDATGYSIYRAETRLGTGSLSDYTISTLVEVGETIRTYTDNTASGNEYYYMVVAQVNGVDSSGTYAVGVRTVTFIEGYQMFSLELEPVSDDKSLSYFVEAIFTEDSSTLYYYDGTEAMWQGHPGFMPDTMNNPDAGPGEAYFVYAYDTSVSHTFTGI